MNKDVKAGDLFLLKDNERNNMLLLISKDKKRVARYRRMVTYTVDEEDGDISIEDPVGRMDGIWKEYHKLKAKEKKKK